MALSDEKLQKGLIMGCGMIHVFKAGGGCGLNVDDWQQPCRWIAVNIKKKTKLNGSLRSISANQCGSW